ncbi:MAG: hypothetical protein ACYCWW_04550 [Deltaproteobacteria bacterium]
MRFALCLSVVVLGATALSQATPADQQWLAQMQQLVRDPSPQAARQRATLAYWALTTYAGRAQRLGIDPNVVRSQGIRDALSAAQGMPNSPGIWHEVAAWRSLGPLDAVAAGRVACPIAAASPPNPDANELCGDCRKDSGDLRGAVHAWRRALGAATDRNEQVGLVVKIERASEDPAHDLANVPPELLAQAHAAEQQQAAQQAAAQASQQAAAQAQAQANQQMGAIDLAEQRCQNSCAAQAAQCHYQTGYRVVLDPCNRLQSDCSSQCLQSSGSYVPPAYQPPDYPPTILTPFPLYPYAP